MRLNNKDTAINDIDKLYAMKEKFMSNKNIDIAYSELLVDIVEYFDMDRIFIGMKNTVEDICIPVSEYFKGGKINLLGNPKDFKKFAKHTDVNISLTEQRYISMCEENNYFVGDEFEKLSDLLPNLGYVPSKKGTPKECLIFCIRNKVSFSYLIMERYEDREFTFSKRERSILADLYTTFSFRIKEVIIEQRLHNEINITHTIISNERMPVCIFSKETQEVIFFNEEYKKLVPNIFVGANYYKLLKDIYDIVELLQNSEALLMQKNHNTSNQEVKYWIKKRIEMKLANGTDAYMVYIKDTDDYIRQLEGIDLLTSAYSLTGFKNIFKELINKQNESQYTLFTLDIAKFKYINDSYGFEVGNEILKEISNIMSKFVRKQEAFCRMNEDKFAMLLQCSEKNEIDARINNLFQKLENVQDKHYLDMQLIYICGATSVIKDLEVNILIDRANMARHSVKGSHKSIFSYFDKKAEEKAKNELSIEGRVSKAVSNGEFVPYLQPKFNLETMKICGAEALVRWITPTGMIFPDNFIPLFEKNGFIETLDFIIYQKTIEHIRNCIDRNLPVYPISLNVSRNHIHNKNFVNQIMDLIEKYDIPIELVELEVTESVFVEDREVLKFFIDNIKKPQIKVSIDDFGTAYSSLQILKDIDIDILKIDKGFLNDIDISNEHLSTKDEIVLKNIINMAKDLGCKVICEGVETEQQIEFLKNIGCELGQGYVFARPMPIEDYERKYLMQE